MRGCSRLSNISVIPGIVTSRIQHTGKLLGLLRRHSPQVSQIALVSNKHDNDVGVRMVPEFFQPPIDIVVGLMLADVVDKKGSDGTAIVSGGDRTVALLAGRIPDLGLDRLRVNLNGAGRELDTNGRLGVKVEFVPGETTQEVGLSDTRVSNKHHCFGRQSPSVSYRSGRKKVMGRKGWIW